MKVYLEHDWSRRATKVWIVEGTNDRRLLVSRGQDEWESVAIQQGKVLPEPSIVFPDGVLEALVREASNVLPATDATTRHLDDAIKVRDRLLAVIAPEVKS